MFYGLRWKYLDWNPGSTIYFYVALGKSPGYPVPPWIFKKSQFYSDPQ